MTTVSCFPMHRQRGEIIRCAVNLDRTHGELASRYWREEMRLLAHRLKAIGMTEAEVSKQVLHFTAAVMEEMQCACAERALQQNDSK